MSELRTNRIVPRDGLPSGSSGGIIQIKSTTKTDTMSQDSSSSFIDITGLSVSITPTRSDSKIFIMANINFGFASTSTDLAVRLVRDSTAIGIGDADGSRERVSYGFETYGHNYGNKRMNSVPIHFLDSPSTTSSTTYKVQYKNESGSTIHINKTGSDTDSSDFPRAISTITVMEVSG